MALETVEKTKTKLELLIEDPNLLDTICAHVAMGGTLVTLARNWGVPFGWVTNWINGDAERSRRYQAALVDRNEFAKETILNELRHMVEMDITAAFDDCGALKALPDWPPELRRFVASMEIPQLFKNVGGDKILIGNIAKLKFHDKVKALELLGKNLSLFNDKIDLSITQTIDINAALTDARNRALTIITQEASPQLDEMHKSAALLNNDITKLTPETPDTKTLPT